MNTIPRPDYPPRGGRQVTARHRLADFLAGRILANSVYGDTRDNLSDLRLAGNLLAKPDFGRILTEAPRVAASGDAWAVRTARTPRGALVVVRLHGPSWSLVLRPARPMSRPMLAIFDGFADEYAGDAVWDLHDPDWRPELIAMDRAILAALDPPKTGGHDG